MKKSLIILASLLIVVFAFVGCKSEPEPEASAYQDSPLSQIKGAEGIPRPEWMSRVPQSEELYYVIGDGREGANATVKKNLARMDGMAKLAQWKSAVVADTMKNYIEESGTIGNTQTLMRFEQATVTRAKANIIGFDEVEAWVDQNNIYHVLYSYPKSGLEKDFEDTVTQFQRNEAAAFADFKAQQAFDALEARLDAEE